MSVEISFLDHEAGLRLTCTGTMNGSELLESNHKLLKLPVQTCKYVLVQFQESATLVASADEIRQVAELDKLAAPCNPNVVIAVVAPTDAIFGLARMWSVFAEEFGWRTMVFRRRPDAEQWINSVTGINFTFA